MIRPASKIVTNFRTRDTKDWQPLHNYIQQNEIFTTSKNQTTRKLAAWPVGRN